MNRIAICLYGQPRNYIDGYKTIKNLMNNNTDYSFHCFFHTWYSSTISHYQSSPHRDISEKDLKIQDNIIHTLIDLYNPQAYTYDEPKTFDLTNIKQSIAYKNTNNEKVRNSINNTISQTYSRTQVRNTLYQYIQNNKIHYDYVVMIRFDFTKSVSIQFSQLQSNLLYYSSIALPRIITVDNLFICSTDLFLKIFDIYDNLDKLFNSSEVEQIMSKHGEGYIINPEEVILISVIYNFYKDKNISQLLKPTNLIPNFI